MAFDPTPAQKKIYDFIENGSGNGIIDAVAGAGKTTTLMGCVEHIPNLNDVLYCAFNTSIRKEIQKKFKDAGINVNVSTIHALGYKMLRATGEYEVDDTKYQQIVKDPQFFETLTPDIDNILSYHDFPTVAELKKLEERRDILDFHEKNDLNEGQQYVNKIISRLLDINHKYRCTLEEDNIERYDELIKHFGIIPFWEWDYSTYYDEVSAYYRLHQKLLKEGNSMAKSDGIIDFTDQIYLPYYLNLTSKRQYGFVFVDECQDLSKAQVYVVSKYLRNNGRLLAVGDPYQAIYGFAGADCNSFERVKKSFNCQLLGLTDCFRCPQNVITLAQSLRNDINGFKKYPGNIYKVAGRDVIVNVKAGDLIICRTRLPLRALAIKLINKDFKVKIHPDELLEFMGDYKRNFTPKEIRQSLNDEILEKFFDKIKERNRKRIARENQNADSIIRKKLINDEVNTMETTLDFLKNKYFDWHLNTLESILKRLKNMLSNPSDDAIKISTIHRAKGLENDRVFILEYDKLPPPRELEWENIQERNLHYVAVTRPKEELYLCESQLATDGDEPDEDAKPAEPVEVLKVLPKTLALPVKESEESIKSELDINEQFINPFSIGDDDTKDFLDLLAANSPTFGVPSFTIRPVQIISKVPKKFYSFDEQDDTPYPSLTRPCQKAKYWAIYENLQDTEYSISNIVSSQYLDEYHINTPNGLEIYKGYYKESGQYNFSPRGNCINAERLKPYFEDESNYKIKFEYNPISNGFEAVHELIQAACQEQGLSNTNIYPENYAFVYCIKSFNSHICLRFMYNGRKSISSVFPSSTLGDNDETLKVLLESLKSLWQQ